jgi:hypothetical protein|tara:strand:+ start:2115 stop:2561 length:447 start_codon:yes stop_codon:yes gene_type:complete
MKNLLLTLALTATLLLHGGGAAAQDQPGQYKAGDTRQVKAFCAKQEEYLELVAAHKQGGILAATELWKQKIRDTASTCYLFPPNPGAQWVLLLDQLYIFEFPKDGSRLRLWRVQAIEPGFIMFLQREFETDIVFYMSWEKMPETLPDA